MTHDTTGYDEMTQRADHAAPPLCLVHYFTERDFTERDHGPPPAANRPDRSLSRVASRDGNLIILEWAAPPPAPVRPRRPVRPKWGDVLALLLLLTCLAACVSAFRF